MGRSQEETSIYNGVTRVPSSAIKSIAGKWKVQVTVKGEKIVGGIHNTEREAALAADRIYLQYKMYTKLNILKPLDSKEKK